MRIRPLLNGFIFIFAFSMSGFAQAGGKLLSAAAPVADEKAALALTTPNCGLLEPKLSIQYGASSFGTAGTGLKMTYTLENPDKTSCVYSPVLKSPANWTVTGIPSAVKVAGGASVSFNVTVTSDTGASIGIYELDPEVKWSNARGLAQITSCSSSLQPTLPWDLMTGTSMMSPCGVYWYRVIPTGCVPVAAAISHPSPYPNDLPGPVNIGWQLHIGDSYTRAFFITNNDNRACGPTTFDLAPTSEFANSGTTVYGLGHATSVPSVTLNPGETSVLIYKTVTSSSGGADGANLFVSEDAKRIGLPAILGGPSYYNVNLSSQFAPAVCRKMAPDITANSGLAAPPGSTVVMPTGIRNADSGPACADEVFDVTAEDLPTGWSTTGPQSLPLPTGGFGTAAVGIVIPASAPLGTYNIRVHAHGGAFGFESDQFRTITVQ